MWNQIEEETQIEKMLVLWIQSQKKLNDSTTLENM
jgi:hypothetical protein